MNRILMALALAVVVAGCSSMAGPATAPIPAPTKQAAQDAWAAAHDQVVRLDAASYTLSRATRECAEQTPDPCSRQITVTSLEQGSFDLSETTSQTETKIDRPGERSVDIFANNETRHLADGSYYLRFTGEKGACWNRLPDGFDHPYEAPFRAALEVLKATQIMDPLTNAEPGSLDGRTAALPALRSLGFDATLDTTFGITEAIRDDLARKTVPVHVSVNADGSPSGFTLIGTEVAAVLQAGKAFDISTAYLGRAQNADASFAFTDLAPTQQVRRPTADQIRPVNAPDDYICPALN